MAACGLGKKGFLFVAIQYRPIRSQHNIPTLLSFPQDTNLFFCLHYLSRLLSLQFPIDFYFYFLDGVIIFTCHLRVLTFYCCSNIHCAKHALFTLSSLHHYTINFSLTQDSLLCTSFLFNIQTISCFAESTHGRTHLTNCLAFCFWDFSLHMDKQGIADFCF